MRLKLLGPSYPSSPGNYRGVERPSISYVGENDDSKANQAFYEYLRISDEYGFVQDLEACRRLVAAYQQLNPPQEFEIVEITTENQGPSFTPSDFLGFDIACAYRISLLSRGLEIDVEPKETVSPDDLIQVMQPLFRLIKAHFKPKLNANGLFDAYDTARFCLDVMMALQKIRSNLWEGDECKFAVLGLWHLS